MSAPETYSDHQTFRLTIAGRDVALEVFRVEREHPDRVEHFWRTTTRTKAAELASYDHHFSGNTRMEAIGWTLHQLTAAGLEPSAMAWPTGAP